MKPARVDVPRRAGRLPHREPERLGGASGPGGRIRRRPGARREIASACRARRCSLQPFAIVAL